MKKILAAVMFMVIMAAGAASAAPEYKIKVAYISSESHPTAQAMTGFAKDVDSASKGRIKVELYPNGQLGSDRELCEGVHKCASSFRQSGRLSAAAGRMQH